MACVGAQGGGEVGVVGYAVEADGQVTKDLGCIRAAAPVRP